MKMADNAYILDETSYLVCLWMNKVLETGGRKGKKRKENDAQKRIDGMLAFTLPDASYVAVKEEVRMWQVVSKVTVDKREVEAGQFVYLLDKEDEAFVNEHVANLVSGELMEARQMVRKGKKEYTRKRGENIG